MFYIIQENLFKESNYTKLINILEKYQFEYKIVKLNPKTLDFNFKTDRNDIFCFGAVAMAKAAKLKGWKYGSMLDNSHDFNVYSKEFGLHNMLNSDSQILRFGDDISFDENEFFVKPVKDSKSFTGQVFTKDSWIDFKKNYLIFTSANKMSDDDLIVISKVKNIQQEVRCWVVDGKVITASLYKRGRDIVWLNYDHETFFTDFAQEMVNKHRVAESFVIDVCLSDNKLKIVEVNNINSAGFYDCNIGKLLISIDDHFSKLYKINQ